MMQRGPSTVDWMLPPEAPGPSPGDFEDRWNVAPERQMSVPEAYRMAGLAGVDTYDQPSSYRHPDFPWTADDKAAREEAKLAPQRAAIDKQYRAWGGQDPAAAGRILDFQMAAQDMLVPKSAGDVAMMLPVARAGRAVLGGLAALDSDEAQAGTRDPRLWSAISKTKLRKPLDEMAHQYTDIRAPVPKFISPEQLLGGYGVFTPWDLSAANKTLTHVDDVKLDRPVRLHGGVGFPEANPGMAAASEQAISRRLDNQAAALAETGKPVYIMPMTMSPQSIDASHHVADPISQLVKTAKIKRDDVTAFNNLMRAGVPDWVSIKSPKFEDYINSLQGGMTTKSDMAKLMATAEWQGKGFPDVASIRHATSEPALIEQPRNTVGMAISRYIPGQGLLQTTHPSYPKGVAGQYMGQLAELVPFEAAAPDIAKGLEAYNAANKAMGKKVVSTPAYHVQKPHKGVPTSQYFDDQWLENMMKLQGER
jgi:hypothetical protein